MRHRNLHRDAGLRSPRLRRRHTSPLFACRRRRPVRPGVDVLVVVPVADAADDARARLLSTSVHAASAFLR